LLQLFPRLDASGVGDGLGRGNASGTVAWIKRASLPQHSKILRTIGAPAYCQVRLIAVAQAGLEAAATLTPAWAKHTLKRPWISCLKYKSHAKCQMLAEQLLTGC